MLDTRFGVGAAHAQLGTQGSIDVQLAGLGGVPQSGVSAVVLNVTVTNPSAASYLTVFPTGGTAPVVSNLNFSAGQTVPNRVVVKVGAGGKLTFFNAAGRVDVLADVAGWFTDSTDPVATGSGFVGVTPTRILDTRLGDGPLQPGETRPLTVTTGPVPSMFSSTSATQNLSTRNPVPLSQRSRLAS